MATRFVKGKARTETPRLKDIPQLDPKTARKPSDGRGSGGRFLPGNRLAIGAGIKALIRQGLGDPNDPATADLVRQATRLYLAIMRGLPSDGPGVRLLVAAQARHATLASHYANEAARAGLATPIGLKLAEAARSHSMTAQRHSVTAYDQAVKDANAAPKHQSNPILDAIEAAADDTEAP